MAQKILLRRGGLANINSGATIAVSKGEQLYGSGSLANSNIGDITFVANGDGNGAFVAVGRLFTGTAAANGFDSKFNGLPYYKTDEKALYRLGDASALDLSGNLEGSVISSIEASGSFNGTFVGNGSGLTNLSLGSLTAPGNSGELLYNNGGALAATSALTLSGTSLTVSGDITGSNLLLSGNANITGNIVLGGNITIGDANTDNIQVGGEFTSDLLPNADSSYSLGSDAKRWAAIYVDHVSGSSAAFASNVAIGGTLGVTGATTLAGLTANATTLGATTLASAAVTNNATVGGTLGVTGNFAVNTNKFTVAATSGNTVVAGTLNAGATTLASAGITNNATVGGTLGVTGATTLSSTLSAGASTLSSVSVTNNANISGNLVVTGSSTLASAAVTNNATVGGTLGVTGATTLSSTLAAGASTLASATITNNASIGGTLGVTGKVSLINDLDVTGSIVSTDISIDDWGSVSASLAALEQGTAAVTLADVVTNGSTTSDDITVRNLSIGTDAANEISTTSGNLVLDSAGGTVTVDDNLTVVGNLTVQGTTTTVDSTQVNIGDRIISLNAAGTAADGGIEVTDSVGTTGTGSLLWNATSDYWYAGVSGSTHYRLATYNSASPTANNLHKVDANGRLVASTITDDGSAVVSTVAITGAGLKDSSSSAAIRFAHINASKQISYITPGATGDILQWNGTAMVASNVIDGGTF